MRSSIFDDPALIGVRQKVITSEERRVILEACDCAGEIDPATGRVVKRHQPGCRHYDYGCGLRPACLEYPAVRVEGGGQ